MYNVFPPTEKQKRYVFDICKILKINPPEIETKQSYCEFIKLHDRQVRAIVSTRKYEARLRRKSRSHRRSTPLNGETAGPHDSDVVDCFDYGIFPWGDS